MFDSPRRHLGRVRWEMFPGFSSQLRSWPEGRARRVRTSGVQVRFLLAAQVKESNCRFGFRHNPPGRGIQTGS